jgi:hypothetical protein
MPVWRLLHTNEAFITNRRGLILEDLVSFMVALHVVFAMTAAAPASFLAQFFAARASRKISPASD